MLRLRLQICNYMNIGGTCPICTSYPFMDFMFIDLYKIGMKIMRVVMQVY